MKEIFALGIIMIILVVSLAGCDNELPEKTNAITDNAPHIPAISIPRIKIMERGISSSKVYVPLEIDINGDLPVITHYGYDNNQFRAEIEFEFDIVFDKAPKDVLYTLYDEIFNVVYSSNTFELPSQAGEYLLRIDASWLENNGDYLEFTYLIKFVIGEPREPCRYIDWYHGGGAGLVLYDGFHELLALYALLEQDDKTIEEYLSVFCNRERSWECPCFLKTRADIQNFFSWLRLDELRLPFSDSVPLREILIRDRYADIYVRYIVGDMLFNFILFPAGHNNLTTEEIINGWNNSEFWQRLTTINEVNIYMLDDFDDPRVIFVLSVNGAYVEVEVTIPCANPDTCDRGWNFGHGHSCRGEKIDRQAAIDGIMQFKFRTLF